MMNLIRNTENTEATGEVVSETGLRSDGELVQAVTGLYDIGEYDLRTDGPTIDIGLLLPAVCAAREAARQSDDTGDGVPILLSKDGGLQAVDRTPYDDAIPKVFRAAEPPPPPFDVDAAALPALGDSFVFRPSPGTDADSAHSGWADLQSVSPPIHRQIDDRAPALSGFAGDGEAAAHAAEIEFVEVGGYDEQDCGW